LTPPSRRRFLRDAALGLASTLGLPGCSNQSPPSDWRALLGLAPPPCTGGFVGQRYDRGHLLRNARSRTPDETERTTVAIIGAGIGGLAAARALRRRGIDDYRLFELEDEAGGNSRGGNVAGYDCPWGAHYLPLPGPYADDVAELLTEYGLRRESNGRVEYDETQLCHSPQERLYIDGGWQDGLLPVRGQNAAAFADYRAFAQRVRAVAKPGAFAIPTSASQWNAELTALDQLSFAAWLDQHQLQHPALRWYLDYCCRDDYGARSNAVSAWAGLHYFASRHGFGAPGDESEPDHDFEHDGLLTWPEGNAHLARRLATPHTDRTQTAALVLRVEESKHGVEVDVLDLSTQRLCRWQAQRAIFATPLFIAARLHTTPPAALRDAATLIPHAPWLVANLYIDVPLNAHAGNAPLSWDNVIYNSAGLGYVNATNQSTQPYAGATVLTYYQALGDNPTAGRQQLLERSWDDWRQRILTDLASAHPDLPTKLRQLEIMRYGHAMPIPAPGVRSSAALAALREGSKRIAYAHSDLSGYSVFEEALHWGLRAGASIV